MIYIHDIHVHAFDELITKHTLIFIYPMHIYIHTHVYNIHVYILT